MILITLLEGLHFMQNARKMAKSIDLDQPIGGRVRSLGLLAR